MCKLGDDTTHSKGLITFEPGKQCAWTVCYPLSCFSILLVDLPSKRDYLENFHPGKRETQNWDPRLLGWLDCHISAKVDFCCFYLRCHVFCFYRQILCPLLNLTDFSKLPSAHTKFQFSLSTSSYPLLLIKWSFGLIHVLLIQIVSKISEKQT